MRWSLVVALILLFSASSSAQPHWERAAYVGGAVVLLGVYDYVGYNLTYANKTALTAYRISFFALQGVLTYLLYEKFGLPSAIGLNLIWWTFGVDMVYYAACEFNTNASGSWASKGAWALDSQNGIGHAEWTPVGIVQPGSRIPGDTIVAQSLAGAAIGIGITISF
jgi:hypothetical protein